MENNSSQIKEDFNLVQSIHPATRCKYPDDIIVRNDKNLISSGDVRIGAGAILDAEGDRIRLENGVKINSGVIIEAEDGPVWIAENAVIEAGAIIKGPAYIGPNSIVRSEARLSDGVSLGPHCRVGGELSSVILQGYSSKQHSGYLGNSYLGSWVNLGAATDNSDLKNNYKPVSVAINGEDINTGSLHVGVFLSDFVRTAIHTRLNSGTMVGVCCNLFGNDFPAKEIPAFTWQGSDGYQSYKFSKALETMKTIMGRRQRSMTMALEALLKEIHDATAGQRHSFMA